MAKFRQVTVEKDTGWYLMNPENLIEALRVAWMLWRHPKKVSALIAVGNEYAVGHWKKEDTQR